MSLTVDGRNRSMHGRYDNKLTQAVKEALKSKKKNADKVDISEVGKKWLDLSEGKVKALNNSLQLNDAVFDRREGIYAW